ncbi:MAG: ATP synthase F1 subunit epsilon [Candidatus Magasanikbacteria bacterium]|jgi:F-type H+-transporting ATPase subunit epsilon|nr:ATP synthase F1 subunit epsilon [Candidatus Magasanikbacteria bacterium]
MIKFKVVTLHGVTYEDDIDKVTIPTRSGAITILENHAPLVSVLKPGEMTIHKGDDKIPLAVSTGIMEIRPSGEVFVMADTAERAEDIDVERADDARKRAEELMKQQRGTENLDFARMQAMIEKELVRVDVGNKYRKLRIK